VSVRRLRLGELLALAGAICIVVALTLPWYEGPQGKLSAWATFGPAVALLMLAAAAGIALALATVTERSTALPVAAAVWGTLLGFVGVIAAIVRVLERPQHATMLCFGAWLGLIGALAVLGGCWQSMRDERTGLYPPADVQARPPPTP
jgi:Na+-transporting NADH:ubiquinone oxidoreductase subunit NqrE